MAKYAFKNVNTNCIIDEQEEWKPIDNCDGSYEVSNLGRVRRTPTTTIEMTDNPLTAILNVRAGVLMCDFNGWVLPCAGYGVAEKRAGVSRERVGYILHSHFRQSRCSYRHFNRLKNTYIGGD